MYTCLHGELLTGSAKLLKSSVKTCITFYELNVIFRAFVIVFIPSFVAK